VKKPTKSLFDPKQFSWQGGRGESDPQIPRESERFFGKVTPLTRYFTFKKEG